MCLIVIVVLDWLAAPHAVTHVVVRPHVQLVYWAPVLVHPGGLAVEERPPVSGPRREAELGLLVAGVPWGSVGVGSLFLEIGRRMYGLSDNGVLVGGKESPNKEISKPQNKNIHLI